MCQGATPRAPGGVVVSTTGKGRGARYCDDENCKSEEGHPGGSCARARLPGPRGESSYRQPGRALTTGEVDEMGPEGRRSEGGGSQDRAPNTRCGGSSPRAGLNPPISDAEGGPLVDDNPQAGKGHPGGSCVGARSPGPRGRSWNELRKFTYLGKKRHA